MWAEVRKLNGHKQEAPVVDGLTAEGALFYSPVDFTDASDLHQSV